MTIPKVLPYSNFGICLRQSLHCVSNDNLGDSDSGQYSGSLNAWLHNLTSNLQHKQQAK